MTTTTKGRRRARKHTNVRSRAHRREQLSASPVATHPSLEHGLRLVEMRAHGVNVSAWLRDAIAEKFARDDAAKGGAQ